MKLGEREREKEYVRKTCSKSQKDFMPSMGIKKKIHFATTHRTVFHHREVHDLPHVTLP